MDPDFERRRDEIAEESLDVPTADLPAFLDSRCGSDTKLRQEVQRILDAAQRMGDGFLETAAAAWSIRDSNLANNWGATGLKR